MTEAKQPTRGERIDLLADRIPRYAQEIKETQDRIDKLTVRRRTDVADLVELVGRPGAAQMLGITGRQLAGMLGRGDKG